MPIAQDGTIVLVSDMHIGGTTALMPPSFKTQDGLEIKASRGQRWLWECWGDLCQRVKDYSRRSPVFVIVNGDITEGNHHSTWQVLTQDSTAHADLAVEVLTDLLQHADGCAFVRGTSVHVGECAYLEQLVAKQFLNRGLVRPQDGFTHAAFKRTIFGQRINAAHHIRGGATHRLRLAALLTMIERSTMSALWHKTPLPDLIIRSHTHHYCDTENTYITRAFTTPCWQFPTSFVDRIAPDMLPHIGAVIIRDGEVEVIRYPILLTDRNYPGVKINGKKTKAKAV